MFVVDRVVAVVKPRQKMLNWLQENSEVDVKINIQSLHNDCTALLIPSFDSPRQARAYIKQSYQAIFEGELTSWGLPKSSWPQELTYQMFEEWFNIEFHSVVLDLVYLEQQKSGQEPKEQSFF